MSDLLAAAQQVFLDKGFAATTVEEITTTTTAAGCRTGPAYRRDFRSALRQNVATATIV